MERQEGRPQHHLNRVQLRLNGIDPLGDWGRARRLRYGASGSIRYVNMLVSSLKTQGCICRVRDRLTLDERLVGKSQSQAVSTMEIAAEVYAVSSGLP